MSWLRGCHLAHRLTTWRGSESFGMVFPTRCQLGGCQLNGGRLGDCPHSRLALKLLDLELVVVSSEAVGSVVVSLEVTWRAVPFCVLA